MAPPKTTPFRAGGVLVVIGLVTWLAWSVTTAGAAPSTEPTGSSPTPAAPSGTIAVIGPDGDPIRCRDDRERTVRLDGREPAGESDPPSPPASELIKARAQEVGPTGIKVADSDPRCGQDGAVEWVVSPIDAGPPGERASAVGERHRLDSQSADPAGSVRIKDSMVATGWIAAFSMILLPVAFLFGVVLVWRRDFRGFALLVVVATAAFLAVIFVNGR